jgi:hypothetical protein
MSTRISPQTPQSNASTDRALLWCLQALNVRLADQLPRIVGHEWAASATAVNAAHRQARTTRNEL